MVKANKMHECVSQRIPDKSGWSALATITTFDRGKTVPHKWKKENALVSKKATTFTTSSLFVESLIDQLCKLFEKDPVSQKKLYELICQKLYDMKLIDKTYQVEEFQFMRSYYQRALYHLLTVSNSPTIDTKLETFLNQSPSALTLPPSTSSNVFDWSRYQNEFEEIDFIARGGFGRVFRVRNKIDRCEYAIKKICLRYRGKEQFIQSLREVRTLANLDHRNIVAYKAAWFEPLAGMIAEEGSSGSSGSKISPELEPSGGESSVSDQESKYEAEDDSGNIIFTNKTEDISEKQSSVSYSHKLLVGSSHDPLEENCIVDNKEEASDIFRCNRMKAVSFSLKNRSLCDHNSKSTNRGCRGRKLIRSQLGYECAVLHIQMQLCKESLREWLDLRNQALQLRIAEPFSFKEKSDQLIDEVKHSNQLFLDSDSLSTALYIFLKILKGVEYVHTMGIVHHDLKPSNIFVEGFEYSSSDGEMKGGEAYCQEGAESLPKGWESNYRRQVRVGDFGLACRLSHPSSSPDGESKELKDEALSVVPAHLLEDGNCLIQMVNHVPGEEKAKEVIGTKLYAAPEQLEGHCNPKSDMYSLGIILFELLHPFFTGMERNKVISALRKGATPSNFEHQHPLLAQVIKDLLSQNPDVRPSIRELIKKIEPIIKGNKTFAEELEGGMCFSEESSIKKVALIQEAQSKDFCQVSHCEYQSLQTRESHRISSSTWEETSIKEAQFIFNSCGSHECHAMREEQERTISKLKEEKVKQDEKIKDLECKILCGSDKYRALREEQEKTISKLKEEKIEKDEKIKELECKILQLQNFSESTVYHKKVSN